MQQRGPKHRARDVDRTSVIQMLNDAYADGQLDADDHERRLGAALQARTLVQLDQLTADLQGARRLVKPEPSRPVAPPPLPTAPVVSLTPTVSAVPAAQPPATAPHALTEDEQAERDVHTMGTWFKGLAGAAAAVLAIALFSGSGSVEHYSTGVVTSVDDVSSTLVFNTPALTSFVEAVHAEFPSANVVWVQATGEEITLGISTDRGEVSWLRWDPDSGFTNAPVPLDVRPGAGAVDLDSLDVAALTDNIRWARSQLGVRGQRDVVVDLRPAREGSRVEITVSNARGQVGTLVTSMSGEHLRQRSVTN